MPWMSWDLTKVCACSVLHRLLLLLLCCLPLPRDATRSLALIRRPRTNQKNQRRGEHCLQHGHHGSQAYTRRICHEHERRWLCMDREQPVADRLVEGEP